ncbi:MAG: hypothetical protein A2X56_00235 [Nitrospirae bacterium GWC2_57_13]|nr:MAG: hypothetical protein A2X56_00235 [Nitrospirae bacterium GWC2_57_13]
MDKERTSAPFSHQAGFKSVLYLAGLLIITVVAVLLQIKFRGFEGPLVDNILILILNLVNFLLLSAVVVMGARSLWKLSMERQQGVLGAKFRTKLVVAFVSLSFIPTLLLFVIASGMFTRSIERLFSLRAENSLKESVDVAQAYYDLLQTQALSFGRQISDQMTDERLLTRFEAPVLKEYMQKKVEEYGLGALELYTSPNRRTFAIVTDTFPPDSFVPASSELVAKAFAAQEAALVRDLGKKGEIVRAVVPLYGEEEGLVDGVVSVSYYVAQSLTVKAGEIRAGYTEYRSALKGKELIKFSYRMGFLAVTLTLLLAAIWVALRVSAGITVPIRKLAEGTEAVAQGNLDYRIEGRSEDEVGMLVDSFNRMTQELKTSQERIAREGAYKETILSNIDTGVVSLDRAGRISTMNPAASRILGIGAGDVLGKRYDDAFSFVELDPLRSLFRRLEQEKGRAEEVINVSVRGRTLTLRTRVSTLRDSEGVVTVITFDDLTDLLRAQKSETWQDVARKIAHEVKNPLTPIKLSAERLRKKYAEGAKDFDSVFDECSLTIVEQADGLKKLLNEFADYARMPRPNPRPQALGPVVERAVNLYASAHRGVQFITEVPQDLPSLPLDAEQMQRVFINLYENAIEAMNGTGRIWTAARLESNGMVRIEIADEGRGVAPEDLSRIFEPYFSSKGRGGGLGLAIVERVVSDHNGSIRAEQNQPQGSRFIMELPVAG